MENINKEGSKGDTKGVGYFKIFAYFNICFTLAGGIACLLIYPQL